MTLTLRATWQRRPFLPGLKARLIARNERTKREQRALAAARNAQARAAAARALAEAVEAARAQGVAQEAARHTPGISPSVLPFPQPDPGQVFPVHLTRDWAPVRDGIEGRYTGIWGAGEFARVVVELREAAGE